MQRLQDIHNLSFEADIATSLGIIAAVVVFLFLTTHWREPSKKHRTARVYRILDGDTVIVSTWSGKETIRLDAIDCPEGDQQWGQNAKYGLIKIIGGKTIRIEEHATDKYGRTIATLYVKGNHKSEWINVNARMVICGHAWVYQQFYNHLSPERKRELQDMEKWAQRKRAGLWRNKNPMPPWDWRRIS